MTNPFQRATHRLLDVATYEPSSRDRFAGQILQHIHDYNKAGVTYDFDWIDEQIWLSIHFHQASHPFVKTDWYEALSLMRTWAHEFRLCSPSPLWGFMISYNSVVWNDANDQHCERLR